VKREKITIIISILSIRHYATFVDRSSPRGRARMENSEPLVGRAAAVSKPNYRNNPRKIRRRIDFIFPTNAVPSHVIIITIIIRYYYYSPIQHDSAIRFSSDDVVYRTRNDDNIKNIKLILKYYWKRKTHGGYLS